MLNDKSQINKKYSKNFKSNFPQNLFRYIPVFKLSSKKKIVWDIAHLIVVIIFIFSIPLHLAFEVSFEKLMSP
jgi:hypothetical protein